MVYYTSKPMVSGFVCMLPLKLAQYWLFYKKRFINYGRTADIKDPKVPQFLIGTDNGFLPRQVHKKYGRIYKYLLGSYQKLPERFGGIGRITSKF